MLRTWPVLVPVALAALGGTALADSFSGFSGVDRYYLVAPDRVCAPLRVTGAKATGTPTCEKATSDRIAQLSIKPAAVERGTKARFVASASGRAVKIKAGDRDVVLVEWTSLDPIASVANVYGSTYADMVAVELVVRRAGREVTDVVGFDLGKKDPGPGTTKPPPGPGPAPTPGTAPPPPADPKLDKALKAARAAKGAKAIAAWTAVLAIDASSSEGVYGLALAQIRAGKKAEAIATLEKLAASTRDDAIEYRVAARFEKAFAAVRSDKKFRAAVGLDKPGTTVYERVMGQGGKWQQDMTNCDKPKVNLDLGQDHKFKLRVESKCGGDAPPIFTFKGTWKVDGADLLLVFPNKGRKEERTSCTLGREGDEDALSCPVDDDLEFTVLPVRR